MFASKIVSILVAVLVLVQCVDSSSSSSTVVRRRFDIDSVVELDGSSSHQDQRELWGASRQWSWSNLLFHLGVCQVSADCTAKIGPGPGPLHCGCPDCNRPHPPHFQDSYCEKLASNSTETEEQEDESAIAGSTTSNSSGGSQTGSRLFKPLAIIAAAAALALMGAAIVMRKRKQGVEDDKTVPLSPDNDYVTMSGQANRPGVEA